MDTALGCTIFETLWDSGTSSVVDFHRKTELWNTVGPFSSLKGRERDALERVPVCLLSSSSTLMVSARVSRATPDRRLDELDGLLILFFIEKTNKQTNKRNRTILDGIVEDSVVLERPLLSFFLSIFLTVFQRRRR